MSNIKQILEEKVAEFNSLIKDEPKYSGVIEGKERSICISVSDGDNYIMFAFKEIRGYSKFGKFVGNGSSSGTFVNTGFKTAIRGKNFS